MENLLLNLLYCELTGCPTKGIATIQMVSATNGIGNKRYRHEWYRHKWYRLSKLIQVAIVIKF